MSKKQRDPSLFLRDILNSIRKIEKYTKNTSLSDLKRNHLVVDAVIRNFEIIGEAVKNIPKEVKNHYPHKKIISLNSKNIFSRLLNH